jgi:hypothetical protein
MAAMATTSALTPAGHGFAYWCPSPGIALTPIGRYETGVFDEAAATIAAYDRQSKRLFVVNGADADIDILDISDPTAPALAGSIDVSALGSGASSVAVRNGVVAVAIPADVATDPGRVAFYTAGGHLLASVPVGVGPDDLTFTPDGARLLVANEGEPDDDYLVDPEGTVSIIRIPKYLSWLDEDDVSTADFHAFDGAVLDPSVSISGPGASVSQDVEPEHIAVSWDSDTAWVTLQENNAIAIVDIESATVLDIVGLGYKDHSQAGAGFDGSDDDDAIQITNWPVHSLYQPDEVVSFNEGWSTFLVTANEGDPRDYDGFEESDRLSDLSLDPTAFPDASALQDDAALGRLKVSLVRGDTDADGDLDVIHAFGGRSISVWNAAGQLVADGGDELEQVTATAFPAHFNTNNDENGFDERSDDSGPEPEGIAVGKLFGGRYAFVGLERFGGIAVYDLGDPSAPALITYATTRDFSGDPEDGTAGDLGPEGLLLISAADSPNGKPLLVVAHEVSGTTTIFEIEATAP